jgi:hypothetical protein
MTMPRMPHSLARRLAWTLRNLLLATSSLLIPHYSLLINLTTRNRLSAAASPPPPLNSHITEYTVFRSKRACLYGLTGFLSDFKLSPNTLTPSQLGSDQTLFDYRLGAGFF